MVSKTKRKGMKAWMVFLLILTENLFVMAQQDLVLPPYGSQCFDDAAHFVAEQFRTHVVTIWKWNSANGVKYSEGIDRNTKGYVLSGFGFVVLGTKGNAYILTARHVFEKNGVAVGANGETVSSATTPNKFLIRFHDDTHVGLVNLALPRDHKMIQWVSADSELDYVLFRVNFGGERGNWIYGRPFASHTPADSTYGIFQEEIHGFRTLNEEAFCDAENKNLYKPKSYSKRHKRDDSKLDGVENTKQKLGFKEITDHIVTSKSFVVFLVEDSTNKTNFRTFFDVVDPSDDVLFEPGYSGMPVFSRYGMVGMYLGASNDKPLKEKLEVDGLHCNDFKDFVRIDTILRHIARSGDWQELKHFGKTFPNNLTVSRTTFAWYADTLNSWRKTKEGEEFEKNCRCLRIGSKFGTNMLIIERQNNHDKREQDLSLEIASLIAQVESLKADTTRLGERKRVLEALLLSDVLTLDSLKNQIEKNTQLIIELNRSIILSEEKRLRLIYSADSVTAKYIPVDTVDLIGYVNREVYPVGIEQAKSKKLGGAIDSISIKKLMQSYDESCTNCEIDSVVFIGYADFASDQGKAYFVDLRRVMDLGYLTDSTYRIHYRVGILGGIETLEFNPTWPKEKSMFSNTQIAVLRAFVLKEILWTQANREDREFLPYSIQNRCFFEARTSTEDNEGEKGVKILIYRAAVIPDGLFPASNME